MVGKLNMDTQVKNTKNLCIKGSTKSKTAGPAFESHQIIIAQALPMQQQNALEVSTAEEMRCKKNYQFNNEA